jgi:pimeloyl-ACP methyl ester carboxylesterase
MNEYLSVFRSIQGEALVMEAYDQLLSQWDVPYEDLYLDTKAGRTHVIVSGQSDSPPLLLIHAFYASAASWYRNVKTLSRSYRVYAVDIIGDPNKSKPVKLIRKASDFIEWFRQVLDLLKIDRCDFIGNSVGAFHVANFALNEPLRVRSMTLIGPAAVFLRIPKFYLNTFPGGMTGVGFLVSHAVKWIENGSGFDPGFNTLFYRLLKYGKATNQVFPSVMTDDQLKQIQIPTLLVYGEKEVIYNYSLAIRRAQQNLKNVRVEIIPGANHITAASRPDLTNEAILKFLRSTN